MKTLLIFATFLVSVSTSYSADAGNGDNQVFVIVHGASGGGWDWRVVDELLSADGHIVFRPTLTGLGEKMHLSDPDIDLTTHINDIANVILFEDLNDIVLVGHSYGGMVISGVMNQIPERIKHAVFLDAFVPEDGMSAIDLWGANFAQHRVEDGLVYFSWLPTNTSVPGDVPQSLKTLTEPVSFSNSEAIELPATLVVFNSGDQHENDHYATLSVQHAEARGWTILNLESDHNAQRSHPKELAALLELRANAGE